MSGISTSQRPEAVQRCVFERCSVCRGRRRLYSDVVRRSVGSRVHTAPSTSSAVPTHRGQIKSNRIESLFVRQEYNKIQTEMKNKECQTEHKDRSKPIHRVKISLTDFWSKNAKIDLLRVCLGPCLLHPLACPQP